MSGNLWSCVDALMKPRHVKLFRDTGVADWTTVPALWVQLEQAVGTGSRRGARSSSRIWSPLDLECMELAATIRDVIVDALAGHDEKPLTAGERPARVLVPDSLRHLASVVTATNDDDLIGWWAYRVGSWCRQIIHVLQLEEQPQPRRIRDTACPLCAATHVTIPGQDGPERAPALLIDFTDGMVRAAQCSACGAAWFRGDDLITLADMIATRRTGGDVVVELDRLG